MERIYLCDENLCNEDENSARENRSPDMGVRAIKMQKLSIFSAIIHLAAVGNIRDNNRWWLPKSIHLPHDCYILSLDEQFLFLVFQIGIIELNIVC